MGLLLASDGRDKSFLSYSTASLFYPATFYNFADN
jgi:hypothetical protein